MSSAEQVWLARAKINLVLRVESLRDDGYHEIDSLMHNLTLHDCLTIRPSDQLEFAARPPVTREASENLCNRAAHLLASHCPREGARPGVRLFLRKHIPVAAGLGGGSADAAATLHALNRWWGCNLPPDRLRRLGRELGADVPFCLEGGAARARGIGEKLDAARAWPGIPLVLIAFRHGLSTGAVYQAFEAARCRPAARVEPVLQALQHRDLDGLARGLHNDLAPVVERLRPETAEARRQLLASGALGAGVSGSGPTVFGLFPRREEAVRVAWRLAARWERVMVTELAGEGVTQLHANSSGQR